MRRAMRQYLAIAFPISYLCFVGVVLARIPFDRLAERPLYPLLLALGCFGPLIATALACRLRRGEDCPGLKGLIGPAPPPKAWLLPLLFLALHFGLALLLGAAKLTGSIGQFLFSLPVSLLIFGSQELGWRAIVQPGLVETRGFWKATVATGLLHALWFLPLFFIPGFVVKADFFLQFAAYVTGVGLLQTTVYRRSGGALLCILFATVFGALSALVTFEQRSLLLAVVAIDVVLAVLYNNRAFEPETRR